MELVAVADETVDRRLEVEDDRAAGWRRCGSFLASDVNLSAGGTRIAVEILVTIGGGNLLEGGNASLAEAVRDSTQTKDQAINSLNSMQSVTTEQIEEGFRYLDCMKLNLQALQTAYGEEGTQNG